MATAKSVTFISKEIKIKGTNFTFQVAELKGNWAIRIINRKENKVLTIEKLKNTSDAAITDKIKNILGRKFGAKFMKKIDFFNLGAQMPELLTQIYEYKETGKLPGGGKVQSAVPEGIVQVAAKKERRPDDFWSAYSTAPKAKPLQDEEISFIAETTNAPVQTSTQPMLYVDENGVQWYQDETGLWHQYSGTQQPLDSAELESSLSILGVNCPMCGAEVDIDDEKCPSCGTEID